MSGEALAVEIVKGLVTTILAAHAAAGESAREAMDEQIVRLHARARPRSLTDAVRTAAVEAHAEIERRRADATVATTPAQRLDPNK